MEALAEAASAWAVVVPVKRLERAKTRLALPAPLRAELALAMALDVTAAALAAPGVRGVLAVTDDPRAARALAALGAQVEADRPDAGLNPALAHGALAARGAWGDVGLVLVSSDVAGVTPGEIGAVTAAAVGCARGFVADAAGVGTTALLAGPGTWPRPAFGPGSAARHEAEGAVRLEVVAPGLRRDVDDLAALWQVLDDAPADAAERTRAVAVGLVRPGGLASSG